MEIAVRGAFYHALPHEVLAEIFLCYAEIAKLLHPTPQLPPPLLLGQIYSIWRYVVHDTPKLWTAFSLEFVGEEGYEGKVDHISFAKAWFERAGPYPLRVSLRVNNFNEKLSRITECRPHTAPTPTSPIFTLSTSRPRRCWVHGTSGECEPLSRVLFQWGMLDEKNYCICGSSTSSQRHFNFPLALALVRIRFTNAMVAIDQALPPWKRHLFVHFSACIVRMHKPRRLYVNHCGCGGHTARTHHCPPPFAKTPSLVC